MLDMIDFIKNALHKVTQILNNLFHCQQFILMIIIPSGVFPVALLLLCNFFSFLLVYETS